MATSRLLSRVDERKSAATLQPLQGTRQRRASSADNNNAQVTPSAHLSCWQHGGRGNCQSCGVGVSHGAILVTDALKLFLCRDCAAKFRARLVNGGEALRQNGRELTGRRAGNENLTAV